jgi:hypothetical protein
MHPISHPAVHPPTLTAKVPGLQWLWPLLACWAGLKVLSKRFDQGIHVDAQQVYLPAAHAFLEQGWAFLLTTDSFRVVPLAYLWPALWGVDTDWIRLANGGLWVGCVFFLWQIAHWLGGYRAGVVAVLLWGFHPELPRYFATELTEPIFLFGLFGWMHAMAQIVVRGRTTTGVAMQGAIMLTVTLLSRPVLQLVAPAGLLLCLAWVVYRKFMPSGAGTPEHQRVVRCISWSLAIGLLLPLALVLKNGVLFGLWGLGTGSGTGLYLGTHPLFQGAEPPFLGFDYDVNALATIKTGNGDHLSLAADRAARAAALWQIQSRSLPEATAFFARKLWWWLAHHPAQLDAFGGGLRKLRLFELLTVATCTVCIVYCWFRPQPRSSGDTSPRPGGVGPARLAFAAFLLMGFVLMLVQLIPILYNSRYSSALLDPWLIPLAAFSGAYLTAPIQLSGTLKKGCWSISILARPGRSLLPVLAATTVIAITAITTYNLTSRRESTIVNPHQMGKTVARLSITSGDHIQTYGMAVEGLRKWVTTESPAVLQVRLDPGDLEKITTVQPFNALWETEVAVNREDDKRCKTAEASYQTADGSILQPRYKRPLLMPLQTDGLFHRLVHHANNELRPRIAGSLRIVLHCPIGTAVEWRQTRLLESRHPWDAANNISPMGNHR